VNADYELTCFVGTVWTAVAHIVTAVIGSGVLALAWSVAQLGWIAGPLALSAFAIVTYYTSTLLANSYRAPDPITGLRNRTYMEAVRSYLSMDLISSWPPASI
jgi:amino acid permease